MAVGAFNIYIIQPNWLTGKGLIPPGEVALEAKLDEPGFRFHSPQQKVRWLVTPTKIAVETDDANEDCGKVLAGVLGFLPETPIVAIGNNTLYEELLPGDDVPHPGFPVDYPMWETIPGDSLKQRTFHAGVVRAGCLYNIQVALTFKRADLLTNAHCQLLPSEERKRGAEHARLFMKHRLIGIELAKHHLIKVAVDV